MSTRYVIARDEAEAIANLSEGWCNTLDQAQRELARRIG